MSRDTLTHVFLAGLAVAIILVSAAMAMVVLKLTTAQAAEPLLIDETLVGTCASGPVMRAGLNELNYRPIWQGSSDIIEGTDQLDRPMTLWETRAGTWLWVATDDAGEMCITDHGWRSKRL